MAELTEKGLAKLEALRDYSPSMSPSGKRFYPAVKMRQKYLLLEVERSPDFLVDRHSVLRLDWNRLKDQGLIEDATVEPVCVIEGTNRPLYRGSISIGGK